MTEVLKKDWVETTLGEVIEVKYGKDHKALDDGKYPCFGSGGLMRLVDSFLYDDKSILIPRKGTLNNIMYQEKPFWTVDTMFWTKINQKQVNPKFLFYQLTLIDYTGLNVGSAVPSLTVPVINELEISLPPLPEQNAIAEILSSLDDKIDLLNRQNKTLEALAETLFRQWFIEEADEAWEEKPLDEVAQYLNGLACQKYPVTDESKKLPVLKIKDLRSGISSQSDWSTSDIPSEYIITAGDVVFSWSGSLLVKIWDGQNCILNQHLFKVSSKKYPKWFYYLWTNFYLEKFIAIAETKATTMGHIKRADLSSSMVIVPDAKSLSDMNNQMISLFEKIVKNNSTILSLTSLRDTLLPKLMSGEVRVLSWKN